MLWGGNFWTFGYYASTVGQYGNLAMITNYVKNQGIPHYTQIHLSQLTYSTTKRYPDACIGVVHSIIYRQ